MPYNINVHVNNCKIFCGGHGFCRQAIRQSGILSANKMLGAANSTPTHESAGDYLSWQADHKGMLRLFLYVE